MVTPPPWRIFAPHTIDPSIFRDFNIREHHAPKKPVTVYAIPDFRARKTRIAYTVTGFYFATELSIASNFA